MEIVKTETKYTKNSEPIPIDFNPDYVLTLASVDEFKEIISTKVLLFDVKDINSYTYICTIKIDKKGNITMSRDGRSSDKVDIINDYTDSISGYVNVITEIYKNHNITLPYFNLASLEQIIMDKIIKILEFPIQINGKFVRCNRDISYIYVSEFISRHIILHCKENKNESNNENV